MHTIEVSNGTSGVRPRPETLARSSPESKAAESYWLRQCGDVYLGLKTGSGWEVRNINCESVHLFSLLYDLEMNHLQSFISWSNQAKVTYYRLYFHVFTSRYINWCYIGGWDILHTCWGSKLVSSSLPSTSNAGSWDLQPSLRSTDSGLLLGHSWSSKLGIVSDSKRLKTTENLLG